jgi:hypothetical protein
LECGRIATTLEVIYLLIEVSSFQGAHSADASKEVGLEVNIEKIKYMLVPLDQNAGQNWDIKIGNRLFENVSEFKYLGIAVTNQNLIQEEIKRRLISGNACYHSVHNLLSSRLM